MNILPGEKFDASVLKEPKNEYAVTYMWFWNVPVSRELIDLELQKYYEAGIRSLYIVPLPKDFSPEELRTFLDPEYLSPEFFELVEYTLRKAVNMGMKPWIYDEGGWPSGGACYNTLRQNPKAKLKTIEERTVILEADKRFVPEDGYIALFNGKHRLPDDYIASGHRELTAYYKVETVMRGCRVDYTNASVTDTFISNTYEKYREIVGDLFGNEIPIIFTDEPGLMSNSIADDEFSLFEKRFGYDLRDYAYVLTGGGKNALTEAEMQARIDHHVLLGELFAKNTFKKLADWCEDNRVYYSGHLDIDNRPYGGMIKGLFSMLSALRRFHVPGVDVIWEQIRYPHGQRAPLDDETLGMGFFPRLASSAARQAGRNVAVTEQLGIYGDGLTHDTIRYVTNYQLMRGINAFNFAPISLGTSRLAALMTRPNFRPEKPGFYNLAELHSYIARMSYLARLGYAEGDCALYMPCRDYAACPDALDEASASFKAVGTMLESRSISFDIIDDEGILSAKDEGDGLRLGDAKYRHFYVPKNRFMPKEVAEKIAPYLTDGEPVYKFENKFLRAMTRRLDEGRLWFIFNEGEDTVYEELNFGEGMRVYELSARDGETYEVSSTPSVTLSCGDVAVFLQTEKEYPTKNRKVEYSVEVSGLVPFAHRRFVLDYKGIFNEYGDGNIFPDADFSGEISYRAPYSLPCAPRADERYKIRLEGFSASASVEVGGITLPLGMSPMEAFIDGKHLAQCGEMVITVANTALNEIHAKRYVIEAMPEAERGTHYKKKLGEFEKRVPEFKLGRVYVDKITD